MIKNEKPPLRGSIFLVKLNPAQGNEIQNERPCVIISPDEINLEGDTLIVVPMTTGNYPYIFRIPCESGGKKGHIIIDQIRTIDKKNRLGKYLGQIDNKTLQECLLILQEMFAY